LTVQLPAKPKPFRSHSIASKPAIVRRGAEGLETADFGHVLLHSKVVTLNALLKMLGDIMDWIRLQKAVIDGCLDRRGEGVGTIRANLFQLEQRFLLEHLTEEALGGIFAVSRNRPGSRLSMARYRYRQLPRIFT
jgi:hypothetical protein